MIYTAKEILDLAGYNAEEKVGKVRVNIGGIAVNDPNKLINTQDATSVSIIVGDEGADVELPQREAPSEAVKAVKEAQGRAATERQAEPEEGAE